MLEHKHPGKHAAGHDAGHHDHHAPGPGKHTQVEHAGPIASAASSPQVSTTASQSASFHEGNVRIDESVSVKLAHGRGPVSVNVSGGGLSVGDDHVGVDFKSSGAATGHVLKTTGASVTTTTIGHAVTHTIAAVAQEIAQISKDIVTSAPDWGPYLIAAIAAVAAAGEGVATG